MDGGEGRDGNRLARPPREANLLVLRVEGLRVEGLRVEGKPRPFAFCGWCLMGGGSGSWKLSGHHGYGRRGHGPGHHHCGPGRHLHDPAQSLCHSWEEAEKAV